MPDILIRGMQFPVNCWFCQIKAWDDEKYVCPFSGVEVSKVSRQDDCPLHVLKQHGKLIDADEFLRTIRPINNDDVHKACTLDTVKKILFEKINEAPTVIPASEEVEE